jgi:hypothetical protein
VDAWDLPELTVPLPPLPPHGVASAQPVYIYAGPGDWRDVRRAWRELVNPAAEAHDPIPRRALAAATSPSPLLTLGSVTETALRLDSQRVRTLAGTVEITPPAGWRVDLEKPAFEGLSRKQTCEIPLHIKRPRRAQPAAAEGSVTIRHDMANERFPLPLIALGERGAVDIVETSAGGQRVVYVDNGWMRLTIAPDHVGSLAALEHNGVNHLASSFPTPGPFSWLNPWFGGVAPVLMAFSDENLGPGSNGRLFEEAWDYRLLRPRRGAAVPWAGVCTGTTLKRDVFRGLRLEADYLTVRGSNVLAVVTRLRNPTLAPMSGLLMTQAYVQPGGDRAHEVVHGFRGQEIVRVAGHEWDADPGGWVAASNDKTGECLAFVTGPGGAQCNVWEMGAYGSHFFHLAIPVLAPGASFEMVSYLVLASDAEQARLYRSLENLPWPIA